MIGDDTEENMQPRPFSFEMPPFDPNLARRPSSFVGIPDEFLLLIGHVIGAWSQFDIAFNQFLKKLLATDDLETDRWEMDSFKKRSARLRRVCKERFSDHMSIIKAADELVADAKRLQKDRNLIAHGHILIKMQTFGIVDNQIQGELSLYCAGTEGGKHVDREYSVKGLERVRYEFAYLCGRMNSLLNGKHLHHLQVTPTDAHALQLFLGTCSSDEAAQ